MMIDLSKDDDAFLWMTLAPVIGEWYVDKSRSGFTRRFFEHYLLETTDENTSTVEYSGKRFYLVYKSKITPDSIFGYNGIISLPSFIHIFAGTNKFEMVVGYEYTTCTVVDRETINAIN